MKLQNRISNWLDEYLIENNIDAFIIGISGGVDSAVTSTLCAMTDKKTIVVTMSIHQNKNEIDRGKKHIEWLKLQYNDVDEYHIDLTDSYEKIISFS